MDRRKKRRPPIPPQSDEAQEETWDRKRLMLFAGAAVVVFAVIFLVLTVMGGGEPQPVWQSPDRGLTEYDNGKIVADVPNATDGQGRVSGDSIILTNDRATLGTQFFYKGAYNGEAFNGELKQEDEMVMELSQTIDPTDDVIQAYMIPQIFPARNGAVMNVTVYVDRQFLDAMKRDPRIVWGWRPNRSRMFQPEEVRKGLYADSVVIPDADRLKYLPSAQPEVWVGDFTQFPLTPAERRNVTLVVMR